MEKIRYDIYLLLLFNDKTGNYIEIMTSSQQRVVKEAYKLLTKQNPDEFYVITRVVLC